MEATSNSHRSLRFGVFEVDFRAAELHKHGVRIRLEEQPFHILTLLLEHPGELVTRDELRQKLWSADTFVDFDRSLNKAISKLRLALGDSAETPRYIETLHRRGYRFIAPVQRNDGNGGNGARVRANQSGSLPTPLPHSAALTSPVTAYLDSGFTVRRWQLIAAVSVVLISLGAPYYLRSRQNPRAGTQAIPIIPRRSVAVLGFRNLSGRTDQQWVSTALSDWLTTELSAGEQLRTIPSESVARMKIELSLPDSDSLSKETLA